MKNEGLPESLILKTPAKINLCLHVRGKRSDGYHDIITVFQMVDLWDEIIMEKSENLDVICMDPEIPTGTGNLIYKAMLKLKEHSGSRYGARITLKKEIPVAAGLGGGSSDAAATLFGLNILWGLGYDIGQLKCFGREIGSDVPFFLSGPSAIGYGRGDELTPLTNDTDYWFLLANPGIHVSTAWAYSEISCHQQDPKPLNLIQGQGDLMNQGNIVNNYKWIGPFSEAKFELTNRDCHIKIPLPDGFRVKREKIWFLPFNDLEEVVIKRYPIIKRIKEKMVAYGALYSLMSGSGSTVFGIFNDRDRAERAYKAMSKYGWRSWIVKALRNSPYYNSCQT